MAKKRNVYTKQSVETLKAEIDSTVEYLETVDPETLTDELDWKVTAKGIYPSIITTIEEVLKTALVTIKECSTMLLVIHELEGMSEYIEANSIAMRAKMGDIQAYYKKRPIASIEHRRASYQITAKPTKANPAGGKKTQTFLVATKPKQIMERNMINKRILETIPILERLDNLREDVEFKGDAVVPPAFILLGLV